MTGMATLRADRILVALKATFVGFLFNRLVGIYLKNVKFVRPQMIFIKLVHIITKLSNKELRKQTYFPHKGITKEIAINLCIYGKWFP